MKQTNICRLSGDRKTRTKTRTRTKTKTKTKTESKTRTKIRTKTKTGTKTGTKTTIGTITKIVRGAYARSPRVQCLYAPSRLCVPSIVAWRSNKQTKKTNRQTRPPSSAGSRPPLPKFSGYVEVDAHYIFHPSTIWVRPHFTELGPKNPSKMPILPWSKRIYVALAAT